MPKKTKEEIYREFREERMESAQKNIQAYRTFADGITKDREEELKKRSLKRESRNFVTGLFSFIG